MARKKISELVALGANVAGADLFEVEESTGGDSKKATLTEVTGIEATARAAQDDVIEAGVGLNADGTYATPGGSNYINGSTDVMDALDLLDTQIKTNADAVAGMDVLTTTYITLSSADILALNTIDKTLIAAQGANTTIEVVSCFAHLLAGGVAYTGGANIEISYDSESDILFYLDQTLMQSGSCEVLRGIVDSSQKEMRKNDAIVARCDTTFAAGTGTLKIFLVYRVITLSACPV